MTKPKITLATLPQATAQEVFDQVAEHLLTQNKQSKQYRDNSYNGSCSYRGDGGLMCAAGCLISNAEYDPEMDDAKGILKDGTAWGDLVDFGFVPFDHSQLITKLQHVHDQSPVNSWQVNLEQVAIDNGLEYKGEQYVRRISSN